MLSVAELEEAVPFVKWREPMWCSMPAGEGWVCRVCIAQQGITAEQVWRLIPTREDFNEHFSAVHE